MKRFTRHGAVVGVVVAALLWTGATVRAQVLQQVPPDALVVFKVNNLKSASDKFAKLAQDLGLAAMSPELADPLGALQAKAKIQQGLNVNGEMAFVMVDPATAGGDSEKALLILLPVSDYKAFLGNWPQAKTEGDVSEVTMPNDANPSYLTNWGNYAAMSPNKDVLSKKPSGGLTTPTITSKEMASKDAVIYANMPALKAKFLPQLQQGRPELINKMEESLKNEPQAAKYTPVIKAVVNKALDVAEQFMNESQAATLGIALVPEGVNTTLMTEFAPGSTIGTNVASMKNTNAALLTGLPTGKYLIYGGGISDPQVGSKLISNLLDPVVKELLAVGPEMKPVQDYSDALKAYVAAQKSQTFGVMAPTGAVGAEPLFQFASIQAGDAKAMASAYTKMMDSQQALMKAFNVPGTDAVKPVHTANAKTIDGVSFDSIVTKVDANAQDPAVAQQAQVMNMIYGPNGAVVDYGVVDDQMLIVSGLSDQVVSTVIKTVKDKQNPLADNDKIKAVAAQLPKQRLAVMYVPVDDIVMTGLSYAKQFGFAMNVQLPPDLPPIGSTVSTEGTAVRVDTHVPTTLVQSLVAAGMQAAMQMQGGGPRGGGL